MTDEQVSQMMIENPSYLQARRLSDGSVALLIRLMFTHAICLGVTEDAAFTTRRFCYEDLVSAVGAFLDLKSKHDIPEGWIASRGLPV